MEYRKHGQDHGIARPYQTGLGSPHTRAIARRRHGRRGMAGSLLLLAATLGLVIVSSTAYAVPGPVVGGSGGGLNSCQGTEACTDNTGAIANNSCQGTEACTDNTGAIANNSCQGTGACTDNTGAIANNSCNGTSACADNSGTIGFNSCNAASACLNNTGTIGDNQCNTPHACPNHK